MHRSHIHLQKYFKTVLNKYFDGFWCERRAWDGLFHWKSVIMDSNNSVITNWIIYFLQIHSFSLDKMLIDGRVYLCCFISCLVSSSDGTHSLQRIHWWASDAMLNFSKSVLMKKNSSTYWMAWGWVNFKQF